MTLDITNPTDREPAPAALDAVNLAVGYGGRPVLSDVEFSVNRGEVFAIIGRNGVGKTTLLTTLAGARAPIDGRLLIDGQIPPKSMHGRVRRGLGFVTEGRPIIRRLSVKDNLKLAKVNEDDAYGYFPELASLRTRAAGLLSGGEQQMLALARTLARRPRLLLIDEVSQGLAPIIVRRLLEVVVDTCRSRGAAVVMVEQQAATALSVADRAAVLAGGSVAMQGQAADLRLRWAEIEHRYLYE